MSPRNKELSEEMRAHSRAVLIATARHCFATRGFFNVRITDVTQLTGMSQGSIYWYFASKEGLLKAVLGEAFESLGAVMAEVDASPGDEDVLMPSFHATRSITVLAPPETIYPWIVQIGMTRAGWYSYDLLDNLGRPSARQLLPEHQHIYMGQLIPMSPD